MFNIKRLICLILALLMIAVSFVACASDNEDPKETSGAETTSGEQDQEDKGDPNFTDEVPDNLDFGKAVINILALEKKGVDDELIAEGESADLIPTAVFSRNQTIEDRLGVTMKTTLDKEPHTTLTKAVSGGAEFDIVAHSSMYQIQSVQKGHLIDLNEVPYINTEKSYWSQSYNNIASYGPEAEEKQYIASGAAAISMFRYLFLTVYNKEDVENHHLTDLYETAMNKEWTLEYQKTIITDSWKDNNANQKMDDKDYYGFITGDTVSVDPYSVAANIEVVSKEEDGSWKYRTDILEKMDEMAELVRPIYNTVNGTYVFKGATLDDTGLVNIIKMFASKQGMMATVQLFALETDGKSMEFDYGVVPMPMLNSTQKEYYSYVQDQVTGFGIASCATADKYPMLGSFLECLASESYKTVVSAYYGTALYKYVNNPESITMLDVIYKSIKFDFSGTFSNIFTTNNIRDSLRPLLSGKGSKALSSTMAKWEKSLKSQLDKFNATLENPGNTKK